MMATREEYVTYAQAKALKELGFDWPCRYHATKEDASKDQYWTYPLIADHIRNSECSDRSFALPTQAVACRWLREEKGVEVESVLCMTGYMASISSTKIANEQDVKVTGAFYGTYEAALSDGLDRALTLLKQKGLWITPRP